MPTDKLTDFPISNIRSADLMRALGNALTLICQQCVAQGQHDLAAQLIAKLNSGDIEGLAALLRAMHLVETPDETELN